MQVAEHYARPVFGKLGGCFQRSNDFRESFDIRWGKIDFELHHASRPI
ncbi:hypothetical protein [Methylomonas koyamae]|nr:hypothetical protein [Methylomonas koyamae]